MCGIVGYVGKKRTVPVIIEGLRSLEYGGYDSAGIAVCGNGNGGALQVRRAEGKLRNLEEVIRLKPLEGSWGIGHTRWATHGGPRKRMLIRIATAPARSWWCTTASWKIIFRSRRS